MGNRKKSLPASFKLGGLVIDRRRPTLPHSCLCSTIGAEELNFRVRDGNGCDLFAMATEKCVDCDDDWMAGYCFWSCSMCLQKDMVKPHGSLVSVSSTRCRASTSDLSTLSSSTSLQVACATGYLILEGVSRLDAFSGYPGRT